MQFSIEQPQCVCWEHRRVLNRAVVPSHPCHVRPTGHVRHPRRALPFLSITTRTRLTGPYSSNSRRSFFSVTSKLRRATTIVL